MGNKNIVTNPSTVYLCLFNYINRSASIHLKAEALKGMDFRGANNNR